MKLLTPFIVLAAMVSLAATASGEDKKPVTSAPTASLVAVMADAGQAMLWDRERGEYVVVKVGDTFQGFVVQEIGSDQIVLRKGELHYVLPRTTDTKDIGKAGDTAKTSEASRKANKAGDTAKTSELIDPYPAAPPPIDPYADATIRVVIAPDGVGVAPISPPGATPAKTPAEPPKVAVATPTVETVPPTVVQPAPAPTELREESYTISRAELNGLMDDFDKLSKEVQAEIGTDGILIKTVSRGSFVHRLGLRDGDLVLNVDGKAVTSLDAAAGVYAHLLDATKFTIKVQRGHNLITLRYQLAK